MTDNKSPASFKTPNLMQHSDIFKRFMLILYSKQAFEKQSAFWEALVCAVCASEQSGSALIAQTGHFDHNPLTCWHFVSLTFTAPRSGARLDQSSSSSSTTILHPSAAAEHKTNDQKPASTSTLQQQSYTEVWSPEEYNIAFIRDAPCRSFKKCTHKDNSVMIQWSINFVSYNIPLEKYTRI